MCSHAATTNSGSNERTHDGSHLAKLTSGLDILQGVGHADLHYTRDPSGEHGLSLVLRLEVRRRSHFFLLRLLTYARVYLPSNSASPAHQPECLQQTTAVATSKHKC